MTRRAARVVIAAIVLSIGPMSLARAPDGRQPAASRGGRGAGPAASPDIAPDRRVTFRLRAPNAREVSVTGLTAAVAMTKNDQGVWSGTTDALTPDIYEYRFLVDGAAFLDPGNPRIAGNNSLLYVPGALWTSVSAEIPHGAVSTHTYESPLMKGTEEYVVYTPPGYDAKRTQPYPVFVVLHGLGGQADHWIKRAGANLALDALIAQRKAVPMVLVSPHAQGAGNAAQTFPDFTKALLTEILPRVAREYNVSTSRMDRAITGLSMGGAQSLLLLEHLDHFAWIGSFSPGFDMYDPGWGTGRGAGAAPAAAGGGATASAPSQRAEAEGSVSAVRQRPVLADGILMRTFPSLDERANRRINLLYLVCGTADDHLDLTRQFRDFLFTKRVNVKYLEIADARHEWPLWRHQFAEMAQMVFKPASERIR